MERTIPEATADRAGDGADGGQERSRKPLAMARATAIALIVLLAVFYAVTALNMAAINQQVELIKEHPYPVSVAAGRVETLLVQLETVSQRLLFVRTPEALDDVERSYAGVDVDLSAKLQFIVDRYTGQKEDALSLQRGYADLTKLQDEFVALCREEGTTDAEAQAFFDERIDPLVRNLLDQDLAILDGSTASFGGLYDTANRVGAQTLALMSVLMAAVLVALLIYTQLLARQRKAQECLYARLQDTLDQAQCANRAKSQFLSNMSHDIRTPMNAIVGLTAIADAHAEDPARVRDCLGKIKGASRHLLDLVNDVLDMNKIESGKVTIDEAGFRFSTLVNDFVFLAQPQVEESGLAFEADVDGLVHDDVVGDPMRINQLLLNLVGNAIKYTPAGSVRLGVAEEPSDCPGVGVYRFVVQDTGIGMSPEFLDKLFVPFERESNATTVRTEGTGLGMAIAKSVVDAMGGSISVKSAVGAGTTFTVRIPLKFQQGVAADGEGGAACACPGDDVAADPAFGRLRGRVLLVEDNELNMEIACELISQYGAEVEQAADGEQAAALVSQAQEGYYALVFMDMQMPRMDGIEATAAIVDEARRTGRRRPPIVAMTANAFNDDRQRALDAGMDGFTTKPINLAEIGRILGTYLDRSE